MTKNVDLAMSSLRAIIVALVDEALAARTAQAEYLSTDEAAELARVRPATVRRWVRDGRLEPHRAGRRVRVRRDQLERLLSSGRRERPALTPEQLAQRDFR